jgi:hypothetical protein
LFSGKDSLFSQNINVDEDTEMTQEVMSENEEDYDNCDIQLHPEYQNEYPASVYSGGPIFAVQRHCQNF